MSEPVRLSFSMLNSRMEECSDGQFVLYEKYEELQKRIEELLADMINQRRELIRCQDCLPDT